MALPMILAFTFFVCDSLVCVAKILPQAKAFRCGIILLIR